MSKGLRRVMLTSDSPQLTLLARLRVLRRRRGGEGGEQEGGARCTFYLFSIANPPAQDSLGVMATLPTTVHTAKPPKPPAHYYSYLLKRNLS
jgi:hypothetical protein